MSGVLVVLEHRGGAYNRMSWEALAAGQQIAAASGQPLFGGHRRQRSGSAEW